MKLRRIVAFGDSIMEGVVLDGRRYSISNDGITDQCGRRLGVPVLNFGRFGSTVTTGEKMVNHHISSVRSSDLALLKYGGNDCNYDWRAISVAPYAHHDPNTPLRSFALVYKSIIDRLRNVGSRPMLLSLPPMDDELFFNYLTRNMSEGERKNVLDWLGGSLKTISNWHELYNIEIFKIGAALDVPVVDITSSFLVHRNMRELLCCDGIHPNDKGQRLITDSICKYLSCC